MLTSEEVMQLQDELQLKPEDDWLRLLYRWEAAAGLTRACGTHAICCPDWGSQHLRATLLRVLVSCSGLTCQLLVN